MLFHLRYECDGERGAGGREGAGAGGVMCKAICVLNFVSNLNAIYVIFQD